MAGVTPEPDRTSVLLSCYLDGELTQEELAEVVVALENDLDAIAEFRSLQAYRRAVRSLPILNAPLDLLPRGHLGGELSAYLDGELVTEEIPVVVGHLKSCDECRSELAELDRARTAVRALPGIDPPAFLGVYRAEQESRRRRIWPAAAVAGGVAALALAFTLNAATDAEPVAIDLADLESRHAAVASAPSVPTGVQVSSP